MFCKFCGSEVEPSDSSCPKCGKKIKVEGGNGFWDMAGEPRKATPYPPSHSEETSRAVEPNVKRFAFLPMAVCAFFCFLCALFLLIGLISNGKKIKECETQMAQQRTTYEDTIKRLGERIASLEESNSLENDDSEKVDVPEPQRTIKVIHEPEAETRSVGYRSQPGYWLFKYAIDGQAISFRWEKQQENGDWSPLEFIEGVDKRYGLRLDEDLYHGISKLVADDLTPDSDGKYRCTVVTSYGTAEAYVELTIKDDQNAVTSSPSPSPSIGLSTIGEIDIPGFKVG